MMRTLFLAGFLLVAPVVALGQTTTNGSAGCAVINQAAADGMNGRIQADDQVLTTPTSVTKLTCLDNFFNGVGLNVLTSFLNPSNLIDAVKGQICAAVDSAWQSVVGSGQCGLSISGFDLGFGGFAGSGLLCPKLSFGGGGPSLVGIGSGFQTGNGNGLYINGQPSAPTGYPVVQTGGVY